MDVPATSLARDPPLESSTLMPPPTLKAAPAPPSRVVRTLVGPSVVSWVERAASSKSIWREFAAASARVVVERALLLGTERAD